ncbi:MAG: hypothetical protein RLZZ531_749, partial [Bacteroidota bacterium]
MKKTQQRFIQLLLIFLSNFSISNLSAQGCDPQSLYDVIGSAYHQSVAQKSDGSWSAWGALMGSNGTTAVLSPQEINVTNYAALTGTPILTSTASAGSGSSEQTILLTTTGLFAWGTEGVTIHANITSSTTFQKLTIAGQTNGLPSGVVPSDVTMLLALNKALAIVTSGGSLYVLNASGASGYNGDGTSTGISSDAWHQVKLNSTTNLTNVIAVRGQITSATKGAFMALTNNNGTYGIYTWGLSTYLGDGSAVGTSLNYATAMTMPASITPKMIAVTGGSSVARNNSYFVLATNGQLFALGSNDMKQLGDFTTTERKSWVNVKQNATTNFNNINFISAQEHDAKFPAAGAITSSGDLYLWGQNGGNMLGAVTADASYDPFLPGGFTSGVDVAKIVEIGGHTSVYLKENSAKFCYVGHKTAGSMGDGTSVDANPFVFDCDATPVINICGSTGWDFGDVPIAYENGGGSNYCMHFYVADPDVYIGTSQPSANDENPHSVVIATDNNGTNGDGVEENGVSSFPTMLNTSTSYTFPITVFNNTGATANLYAWVDWNNNGKFQSSELYTTTVTSSATSQIKTAAFSGLSALTDGRRYVRIRLSTFALTDNTGTTAVDERSLGFLADGEVEDHSFFVTTSNPNPNVAPVTNNVANSGIIPLNASATDIDSGSSSDSDGTVVAYRILSLPSNGVLYKQIGLSLVLVTLNEAMTVADFDALKYQPNANYAGSDVFTYTAIDDDGAEDATPANFNINVHVDVTADAGPSTAAICSGNTYTTSGTSSNGTIAWTSSGTGTFTNGLTNAATYTPSAADITIGSVTLTMTVTGSTSATDNLVLTINSSPLDAVGSVTQPTCGTPTGSINISSPTGANLQYASNGGTYQTSAQFTSLNAGAYSITVKNTTSNCVSAAVNFTVNAVPSAPSTPTASVTAQPTCGTPTGTIVFTTQSGVEYSINGTTYQASATFTGVAAGTYTLSVRSTTDNTCITTGSTVTVNAAASAPSTPTASVTAQPTCGTPTGTIVFTTQSGVEYSINGTTYQASATFTGVAAGTYTLSVRSTTDNTCITTGSTVTVNAVASAPSTPTASVTAQPTCGTPTGTIVFTTQSGVEYSINGTTYQASATFTGVAAGTYTLRVRSTTDNTCITTGSTVTVNAVPSAPSTPTASVTAQPTCGTPTGTIVFTTQSGVEYSINGTTYQASASFTGVAAGTYTLSVRSTTDNTCITTGSTVTVNAVPSAPSTPTASVTAQPTCGTPTGTIVFTTQSGVEYSINGTTYQASASFTGVAAGTYTL